MCVTESLTLLSQLPSHPAKAQGGSSIQRHPRSAGNKPFRALRALRASRALCSQLAAPLHLFSFSLSLSLSEWLESLSLPTASSLQDGTGLLVTGWVVALESTLVNLLDFFLRTAEGNGCYYGAVLRPSASHFPQLLFCSVSLSHSRPTLEYCRDACTV